MNDIMKKLILLAYYKGKDNANLKGWGNEDHESAIDDILHLWRDYLDAQKELDAAIAKIEAAGKVGG